MSENDIQLEDLPGVGAVTAKKLREAGFYNIKSVAVAPSRELSQTIGIRDDRAASLSKYARELLHMTAKTAKEFDEERKRSIKLTTGCKGLDEILGGGVETRYVMELIGQYGSGKTQVSHALCVNVQQVFERNGLEGTAYYIDTEGTFRPERITEIARNRGVTSEHVLSNILFVRAYNSDHQIQLVEQMEEFIEEKNIKLIIVDSIISHFRAEYLGRESLAIRQQKLNKHLHRLLRIAETYNVAVVVTNQVVASPDAMFGPPNKPAGGHVLAHLSTTRIYIRRARRQTRIARVIDSPHLIEGECVFQITEKGIEDLED
jgi:DNA repair protein RadA